MGEKSRPSGLAFASFLITEQSAIFCGVMLRTTGRIRDTTGADVWVMNSGVRYLDDVKAISDDDVFRVRCVTGVAWAVNLYKGAGEAQLADGTFQAVQLLGVDDASLAGAPNEMVVGRLGDLQQPDAILVDEAGFHYMWPKEPLHAGKVLEMNDCRAVVVGVYRASQTFQTQPILYTRNSQATLFVPPYRRMIPFVLAKGQPGVAPEELARRIEAQTGLKALSKDGFTRLTMSYYLRHTGLPVSIGTTVLLAFLVGCAIAGQTFYLFTVENLKQFGTLKAMGASDRRLVGMILLQALAVGVIGYGVGVGLATLFGIVAQRTMPLLAFFLPWQVLVLTGVAVVLISLASSVLSIRRVLVLEPAAVFQG